MVDQVPPEVLWNPLRGQQAADVGLRLREDAANVQMLFDELERSPLARWYLDLPRMRNVFGALQQHVDPAITYQITTVLLRGLMVGMFLQQVE